MPFLIISYIIVIHELGHFIVAKILNVEVDKIYLYPLGGISKFFLPLNSSIIKELFILISGPLSQVFGSFVLINILPQYQEQIMVYNLGILIFNLLPIYPLDGGKLLNLLMVTFIPFLKSLRISIIISYITIFIYLIVNLKDINISTIIVFLFLLHKVTREGKQIKYIYERFVLERFLNDYKFTKSKIIKSGKDFYKNKRHLVYENDNYYLEKEYLEKKYKNNKKNIDNKNYTML